MLVKRVPRSPRRRPAGGVIALPQRVRGLRMRLSAEPDRPLSQQRFSVLLGVSWSTVARWEGGGRIDAAAARRLASLQPRVDRLALATRTPASFARHRRPRIRPQRAIEFSGRPRVRTPPTRRPTG